ncbi:RNAse P Rpr2/Rpp21/SNM1 subunit domain-containing protein [Phlebopus sp. FC_14]|nr:RNAse P Rpr2/Rpp21/SNM1 subunit domain-containing protein [Phlebopus sp. FC_14]
MGKNKNKDDAPNPNSISNRDIIQRLNFLYQASVLLNGVAAPDHEPSSPVTESSKPERPHRRCRRTVTTSELSRSYIDTMKVVGTKTNVKMDPSVKRLICKTCSLVLVPGVSSTVRVKNSTSHGHLLSYTCHSCLTERRIPAPPVLDLAPAPESGQDVQAEPSRPALPSGSATGVLGERRRKKKTPTRRLPPHFARNVGHVVFRGNERLPDAFAS